MKRLIPALLLLLALLPLSALAGPEGLCDPVPAAEAWQDTEQDCIALTTPEEAMQLAGISKSAVANRHPGYTLLSYASCNSGSEAEAAYMKVENGVLHVRRAVLEAGKGVVKETNCIPAPLSAELLSRLITEPADTLLDISGYSSLFQTDAGLDTSVIPVEGRVLESDLQTDALILLTEDDAGVRRLTVVSREWDAYRLEITLPLPEDTGMDIFHAGDNCISLEWEGQRRQAAYQRRSNGVWQLQWVMNVHDVETELNYAAAFCGVQRTWSSSGTAGMMIGTPTGLDLMQADLDALPGTEAELAASLDRTGWAVVSNPDPADRLHLRVSPDQSAVSLGKFWNGTPVRVLEEQNGWCRVEIGTDGHLQGWMMKQYLTFGAAMDSVDCAFPQLFLKEEGESMPLYTSASREKTIHPEGDWWIAGLVENDLYVILTDLGETGYAPQSWFTPGNG